MPCEKYFNLNGSYTNTFWNQVLVEIAEELKILIIKNRSKLPSTIKYITCRFDDGDLIILFNKD